MLTRKQARESPDNYIWQTGQTDRHMHRHNLTSCTFASSLCVVCDVWLKPIIWFRRSCPYKEAGQGVPWHYVWQIGKTDRHMHRYDLPSCTSTKGLCVSCELLLKSFREFRSCAYKELECRQTNTQTDGQTGWFLYSPKLHLQGDMMSKEKIFTLYHVYNLKCVCSNLT